MKAVHRHMFRGIIDDVVVLLVLITLALFLGWAAFKWLLHL